MLRGLLTSALLGFLLKLFTGIAAVGFGIFGIGAKTREENGRLTRSGWIALIGLVVSGALVTASSVYEFASGQEREQAERRRSERLILSVQRGVYPMRGLRVSFEMRLGGDFAELAEYKKRLHDVIARDRLCKNPRSAFFCYGYDDAGRPNVYDISATSPLFPGKTSRVWSVLENLYIHVSLFKRLSDGQGTGAHASQLIYLGRFFTEWGDSLPHQAWLRYDYERNILTFGAAYHAVHDDEVGEAGVYSLVDIIPGVVAAAPSVSDDQLCQRLELLDQACLNMVDPLIAGLALEEMQLVFPYPKRVVIREELGVRCQTDQGTYLAVRLPDDIDSIDDLGNIKDFQSHLTSQQICEAIARTNPGLLRGGAQ